MAGCSAPQDRGESKCLHQLDDEKLIDELRNYDGTPAELLASRELMEMLLPSIRADLEMAETYVYNNSPLLSCPISALSGQLDDVSADALTGWQKETTGSFDLNMFEGGHFFVQSEREAVLRFLRNKIRNSEG